MTQTELNEVLCKHVLWLNDEPGGQRADTATALYIIPPAQMGNPPQSRKASALNWQIASSAYWITVPHRGSTSKAYWKPSTTTT